MLVFVNNKAKFFNWLDKFFPFIIIIILMVIVFIISLVCGVVKLAEMIKKDNKEFNNYLMKQDTLLYEAYCKDTGNPKNFTKEEFLIYLKHGGIIIKK